MAEMRTVLRLTLVTGVFTLACGFANGQQVNPNRLPPCPKPDYSKNSHAGVGGRTEKWHNCFGRYILELNDKFRGDVFEGEFQNGSPNGQGTYLHLANNEFKGQRYVGEYKTGRRTGLGTFTFPDGQIYVGEFKDDDLSGQGTYTFPDGRVYVGEFKDGKYNGRGTFTFPDRKIYVGEFKDGKYNGQGTFTFPDGEIYVGEFKDSRYHGIGKKILVDRSWYYGEWQNNSPEGQGIRFYSQSGERQEGIWENGNFIRAAKVNLPNVNNNISTNADRTDIDRERQQLAEERRRLEEDKRQREQQRRSQRLTLMVSSTQPASDGSLIINVQTNADTASLLINGEEQGGRANGDYIVKKVARAGQETIFTIVATDINGNTDTKTIAVSRQVVESKAIYAGLNPTKVKRQPERDAVAVVIGIADYRSLPKAEYANDDARVFYDYAIRALGVKPENIKLLVDGDAEEAEILKTFRTWVPSRVKSTTDVYLYYSGHGLPTQDGQGLYLLPPRADREVIDDTAIPLSKINAALQLAKPRSVTIFMDACYSGQARSGETLVASARPISLRTENRLFPDGFTVFTASQHDQISSSSPDLQHGIFSYYLMRGMEGDADANRDGKITLGEMQAYLAENVGRQAAMMSRKQQPQLIGDSNRLLVGR
jgi:hypothetical protein